MITIPDYVYAGSTRSLTYDSSRALEYKITETSCNCEVMLTANILLIVLRGKKEVFNARGEKNIIEENQGIFLKKGNYIIARTISGDKKNGQSPPEKEKIRDECLLVYLDDKFIREFLITNSSIFDTRVPAKKADSRFTFTINPFIEAAITSLFPLFAHENRYKKTLIGLKSSDLLLNIISSDSTGTFFSILKQCAADNSDLSSYMALNFTRPLSVEQFARETNRSLTTYKKDFKALFQMPPKKWINKQRLQKACTLLKNSSMSVTDIGFVVGFSDTSHFISLFKKEYKVTPKQFQSGKD